MQANDTFSLVLHMQQKMINYLFLGIEKSAFI